MKIIVLLTVKGSAWRFAHVSHLILPTAQGQHFITISTTLIYPSETEDPQGLSALPAATSEMCGRIVMQIHACPNCKPCALSLILCYFPGWEPKIRMEGLLGI